MRKLVLMLGCLVLLTQVAFAEDVVTTPEVAIAPVTEAAEQPAPEAVVPEETPLPIVEPVPTATPEEPVATETVAETAAPVEETTPVTPEEVKKVSPEEIKEIVGQVGLLVDLFKSGQWALALGVLLTLLVMIFRKFFEKMMPKKALPWVAVALGILASIGASLGTGMVWWQALLQGFAAGATASGLWELVFKHFKKTEKVA